MKPTPIPRALSNAKRKSSRPYPFRLKSGWILIGPKVQEGTDEPSGNINSALENITWPEHHMAYQAAFILQHEVQFRNKVGTVSVTMQHEVLRASRTIYIPESFAREVLDRAVIFRSFESYLHSKQIYDNPG